MAGNSTFDPDAFMAQRQISPPASSGGGFDPDAFMSSRTGDKQRDTPQQQSGHAQPTFIDRISTEMNQGGRVLDPESVVRGVGDSLGRTTRAWGDMFSGKAGPSTLPEMVPLLGPAAVDAGRNLATPGRRLEGLTDSAMLLWPAAEGGFVRESGMPLQYAGEPLSKPGRTVIPSVPQSVIEASHLVPLPGVGMLRMGARGVNALGRLMNRPEPEAGPSAFPPEGRRVYDMRMSPQSPASYDPRPLPDISDRGNFGRETPSMSPGPASDDAVFDAAPKVNRPLLPEAWQIPNKSYPLPSREIPAVADARSGSYQPISQGRVPTPDELAFDATPKRFIDPHEPQVVMPNPPDTPVAVRERAKTSRAKFDENGKRNQLKSK